MNESPAKSASSGSPATLRLLHHEFDLTTARCQVELSLLEQFRRNEDLQKRIRDLAQEREQARVQQLLSLITDGYRVDEEITPRLFRLGKLLSNALRLSRPLDIFVMPSHELNAYCLPSRKGNRLIMCLYSGLLSVLSTRELLFVMGHEVGHAILHHGETLGVSFDNPDFSPIEVVRLRALDRAQEISCDRVGLLACQDVRVASTALFKVASGLTDRWMTFNESAYAKHFDHLSSMAEIVDLEDASRSHPHTPLRVKALIAFSNSERYARAFGLPRWTIPHVQMEEGVEMMLSVLDPDLSALENEREEEAVSQFLLHGALLIIAADGICDPDEVVWLNKLTGKEWSAESLANGITQESFLQESRQWVIRAANILRRKLSERQRAGLFHAMCQIAVCAGGIPDEEAEVLDQLRKILEISEQFAGAVLSLANESRKEGGVSPANGSAPEAEGDTATGGVEQSSEDALGAVLNAARLTESSMAEARSYCDQLRSQELPVGVALRALVSWAVTASGKGGPITNVQGKRIALSAVQICRQLTGRRPQSRGSKKVPVEKNIRDYGVIAIFRRGETVRFESEEAPYSVVSVSRARNVVGIARDDDPTSLFEVAPHTLWKDPVEVSSWPLVLAEV